MYKLDKQVLSVKNIVVDFLNGLTSNELDRNANAFCNIHGRIIAVFDQIQISEEEFLLCLERPFVEETLNHLDRYAKLSGVQIEKKDYNIYFDTTNNYSLKSDEWAINQKAGKLVISDKELPTTLSLDEFTRFRLANHIPIQGIDFQHDMLLNVSLTDFVSFEKGCFLGQEPISKVYNRSKPTWKLQVKFQDECSDSETKKMTSQVKNEEGRIQGFVFVKND